GIARAVRRPRSRPRSNRGARRHRATIRSRHAPGPRHTSPCGRDRPRRGVAVCPRDKPRPPRPLADSTDEWDASWRLGDARGYRDRGQLSTVWIFASGGLGLALRFEDSVSRLTRARTHTQIRVERRERVAISGLLAARDDC